VDESKIATGTSNFWKYGIKTNQSEEVVRKKLLIGTRTSCTFPNTMSVS